jgi:hypothetical protein
MTGQLERTAARPEAAAAVRILRAMVALAALAAIGYEIAEGLGDRRFSLADYFSYFTVQSNLFAAAVLLVGAARVPSSRRWAWVRGASTVYLVVTGLVYAFLLAPGPLSLDGPWNDTVVHRVVPLAMLLDWLLLPPRRPVPWPRALWWLACPIAFLAYSLVRGEVTGFYPYDFLDPTGPGGFPRVALWSVGLCAGVTVLSLLVAARRAGPR